MKGYRKDGVFCFIKAFDLCKTSECGCERTKYSAEMESIVRIATLMMEEHEEIFEDE